MSVTFEVVEEGLRRCFLEATGETMAAILFQGRHCLRVVLSLCGIWMGPLVSVQITMRKLRLKGMWLHLDILVETDQPQIC